MKIGRRVYCALVILTCVALAIPSGVSAQAGQQAGKISVVIPSAYLVRASQQLAAAPQSLVMWGDVINTGHLSRVRVSLTDGSILNVGSDSNLTVAKHDAASQQTDLDLNFGRVRAKAVKLSKPDAHFQIRTSVGVAGVVGTEMIVSFEATPDNSAASTYSATPLKNVSFHPTSDSEPAPQQPEAAAQDLRRMSVYCLEGHCKICDNAGHCITMAGGQFSTIRGNSAPAQPAPMTPLTVTQAVNSTTAGAAGGAAGGAVGATTITAIGTAVGTGVAIGVVRAVATTKTCPPPPPTSGGVILGRANASCTTIVRGGVITNGQR
jgi:hypothetical protein